MASNSGDGGSSASAGSDRAAEAPQVGRPDLPPLERLSRRAPSWLAAVWLAAQVAVGVAFAVRYFGHVERRVSFINDSTICHRALE